MNLLRITAIVLTVHLLGAIPVMAEPNAPSQIDSASRIADSTTRALFKGNSAQAQTIKWLHVAQEAYEKAIKEDKFLLAVFLSDRCPACDDMVNYMVGPDPARLNDCVVFLNADPSDPGAENLMDRFDVIDYPTSLLILPNPSMVHSVGKTEGFSEKVSYNAVLRNHMRKAANERQPFVPQRFLRPGANFCD